MDRRDLRHPLQQVIGPDLVAPIRRKGDAMAEEEYLPPHPSPRAMNGPMRFATGRGSFFQRRSEEPTSELQSLMRTSYAVFCLTQESTTINQPSNHMNYATTEAAQPQHIPYTH